MDKKLLSVGLDVGTSTTQMIVSRLTAQNRASAFVVPDMTITEREVLYRSPVYFTPLLDESHVDGEKIRQLVRKEYETAGITPEDVDTGAVIITGETSRKENARAVLRSISSLAGNFVVATAGPDLESVLAAKGAGAVSYSEKTGKTVLHMDIGGGTSNLALIKEGKILRTGCLNVGGRLIKLDENRCITYVSPVLSGLTDLKPGASPTEQELMGLAHKLAEVLEMAAGLRKATEILKKMTTEGTVWQCEPEAVISFSGGVADCIGKEQPFGAFGDMGPELGKAIRQSALCGGQYMLGAETIRATVIGAGCHSAQLSGSTVFCRNVELPLQNLPVIALTAQEQLNPERIREKRKLADGNVCVLSLPGFPAPTYDQVESLARALYDARDEKPLYLSVESDMAKALGQKLALLLEKDVPCLCIDRLHLTGESYLDVGRPVGPAFPVVIKTLVLQQ